MRAAVRDRAPRHREERVGPEAGRRPARAREALPPRPFTCARRRHHAGNTRTARRRAHLPHPFRRRRAPRCATRAKGSCGTSISPATSSPLRRRPARCDAGESRACTGCAPARHPATCASAASMTACRVWVPSTAARASHQHQRASRRRSRSCRRSRTRGSRCS